MLCYLCSFLHLFVLSVGLFIRRWCSCRWHLSASKPFASEVIGCGSVNVMGICPCHRLLYGGRGGHINYKLQSRRHWSVGDTASKRHSDAAYEQSARPSVLFKFKHVDHQLSYSSHALARDATGVVKCTSPVPQLVCYERCFLWTQILWQIHLSSGVTSTISMTPMM
jgi:hypothetical protein